MMKMTAACLKLTYRVMIAVLLMHSPCILTDGLTASLVGSVGNSVALRRKQQSERTGKPTQKGAQAAL